MSQTTVTRVTDDNVVSHRSRKEKKCSVREVRKQLLTTTSTKWTFGAKGMFKTKDVQVFVKAPARQYDGRYTSTHVAM